MENVTLDLRTVDDILAESNERANLYRDRILKEVGPEPKVCSNPYAWIKWYEGISKIYKEIYK
jgi:hypothetical protein